jgi:5S rRNA maturation endonuclease (ribonuclease M5)
MQVGYDNKRGKEIFHCYGDCGIDGDIYDAVEILEGIKDKKEQFLFLEKLFDGGKQAPPAPPAAAREKESFTPDPAAQSELEKHLNNNPAAEKEIIKFLDMRALVSSKGLIQAYPDTLIPAMVKNFFYWPGLDVLRGELDADLLRRAGIPLQNPKTGIAWWDHSGVILKLGKGYKLHYYQEGECKKFGSKGSSTFPMPGAIDKTKPVIIVEGEMDAISSNAIGIENLFSSGGTNGITGPKIKNYLLDVPEIILFFDADEAGRKASGLISIDDIDKRKTNIPETIIRAGYTGKIKIAELPTDIEEKDQDALIIAGKLEIVISAIKNAKEYIPPEKKADDKNSIKWDFLTSKRLKAILKKITRDMLDEREPDDIQIFISAILKAAKKPEFIKSDLESWGAKKEEIENQNDVNPYILMEFAWKYGLSKYLQRVIKIELTPASELLKRINQHKPIVDIDYEGVKENKNIIQFMTTKGVRSAALFISDILDGRMIYTAADERFYFFNGHVWLHQPDMTGIIFNIISAVMYYFIKF